MTKMMKPASPVLRVIGDVHQKIDSYIDVINRASIPFPDRHIDESIQVGDMGCEVEYFRLSKEVDPLCHRFVPGNHDEHPAWCDSPHAFNPDFGTFTSVIGDIFYIRGAESVGGGTGNAGFFAKRTPGFDFWAQEQIGWQELQKCIEVYADTKPEIVISHTCPDFVKNVLLPCGSASRTEVAMKEMWDLHVPKVWIFGHFHMDRVIHLSDPGDLPNSTQFICLDVLSYIDIIRNEEGKLQIFDKSGASICFTT